MSLAPTDGAIRFKANENINLLEEKNKPQVGKKDGSP
jgi:hypothetical protein